MGKNFFGLYSTVKFNEDEKKQSIWEVCEDQNIIKDMRLNYPYKGLSERKNGLTRENLLALSIAIPTAPIWVPIGVLISLGTFAYLITHQDQIAMESYKLNLSLKSKNKS